MFGCTGAKWPIAVCGLAAAVACAGPAENLLQNPGFERVTGEGQIANWSIPTYWSGELAAAAEPAHVHDGERSARLRAAEKGGRHWGRVLPGVVPVTVGLRYRFAVWARGNGGLKLGAIHYVPQRGDEPHYRIGWQETPTQLTDEWQEVAFEFLPVNADVYRVATMIEVEGEGAEAHLDDAAFIVVRRADGQVVAEPSYAMVQRGQAVTVKVTVTEEGEARGEGQVTAVRKVGEAASQEELALDETGTAAYQFEMDPAAETGLQRVTFVNADLGAAATAYVDVVDAETHQAFAAVARETRIDSLPAHLLFLGDSLTYQRRGYNYVDRVGYWLQQAHGEQVTVKNSGVGGDYITRVWQRLNGDPKVYSPAAYEGLYDPQPTHVFIFLGHNDTKLTSGSGFTESVVSPEDYEELHRKAIQKIGQETGARFTILSSASSVYEITKPRAEKLLETRGAASLFGKPEVLERYNAIAKRLAEELGCGFLDVYEPTRAHPDKPSLFAADGVHLSREGNHLIALEVLRHLGE